MIFLKRRNSLKTVSKKNKKAVTLNKNKSKKKKQKKRGKILLTIILIIVIGIVFLLILYSDLFNIKNITVLNNSKVTTQEIIQNSGLAIGNNMFKTFKTTIKKGIKTNPYIENVKITKKINGEVILEIEERTPTYMLNTENGYAYINNQGYILEMSLEPLQKPEIIGYQTVDITPGKRLEIQDLQKLNIVIQIMKAAGELQKLEEVSKMLSEANIDGIQDKFTVINISDANNFIIEIPSEGKTVEFGDETCINVKILWIIKLILLEKGNPGTIVVNTPNINIEKKAYFREQV